jgi:hypothetical protein
MAAAMAILLHLNAPAQAAAEISADVQVQIDAHLAAYPGGTQISPTEISYGGGAFIMTFERPKISIEGSPDCPRGWFCFYDYVNYGYPRGKLSDCGKQDLGTWGWRNRTESVHHNQSSGSVVFIDLRGGLEYYMFSVSPSKRTIGDVYGFRNLADLVLRFC